MILSLRRSLINFTNGQTLSRPVLGIRQLAKYEQIKICGRKKNGEIVYSAHEK